MTVSQPITRFITSVVLTALFSGGLSANESNPSEWHRYGGADGRFTTNDEAEHAPSVQHATEQESLTPSVRWQKSLGQGMAQTVVGRELFYAFFLEPFSDEQQEMAENLRTHRETVVAFDRKSGKEKWKFTYDAGWIDDQQAFGGRSRAPQATPLLIDGRIVTIGFTGKIHCLNARDGKLCWMRDAVNEFSATPVQFGFSASPIEYNGKVVMLTGGEQGGLVCLEPVTGETLWNAPCQEASYATPVQASWGDQEQFVFVTRRRIVGVDASTGKQLWEFELPKSGLTNVPTPCVLDDGLIVAGQGIGGTMRLKAKLVSGRWVVEELWQSTAGFFYCNWLQHEGVLYGCNGDILLAVDVATGASLGKWRGYKDANLVAQGRQLYALDGSGKLTILRHAESQTANRMLKAVDRFEVLDARCWTVPTVLGTEIYCRGDDKLICIELAQAPQHKELKRVQVRRRELKLKTVVGTDKPDAVTAVAQATQDVDPALTIVDAYDQQGKQAAWQAYLEVRRGNLQELTLDAREELIRLAVKEGLSEFAALLLSHIEVDFPNSLEAVERVRSLRPLVDPQPAKETHLADNGLLYLELGVRNNTVDTYHTEVKGPKKHPFGYGIPFRPGKTRIEKWPVGTRLYRMNGLLRGELLLEVKAENAGQIVDLKPNKENTSR